MSSPVSFNVICRTVLISSKTNEYAKAYAAAGLEMTDREEIRVQALYLLSNLSHWRGPEAKATKDNLKLISNGRSAPREK